MLAMLSQQVERTPDELNYQYSGRRLVAGEPPARVEDRFQGPLIFLATQITDAGGRLTEFETLARARLGMLVFPAMLLFRPQIVHATDEHRLSKPTSDLT